MTRISKAFARKLGIIGKPRARRAVPDRAAEDTNGCGYRLESYSDHDVLVCTMPMPPSVNVMWRNVNGNTVLSKAGKLYRKLVVCLIRGAPSFGKVRLRVLVRFHEPDNIRRDLDNFFKAPLDALRYARVYDDDSQIDDLRIVRGPHMKPGRVVIEISAIGSAL